MNKQQSSRFLRLEQLESRCMLAVGIFSYTDDRHNNRQHDAPERSQLIDGRFAINERASTFRASTDRASTDRASTDRAFNAGPSNGNRFDGGRPIGFARDRGGLRSDFGSPNQSVDGQARQQSIAQQPITSSSFDRPAVVSSVPQSPPNLPTNSPAVSSNRVVIDLRGLTSPSSSPEQSENTRPTSSGSVSPKAIPSETARDQNDIATDSAIKLANHSTSESGLAVNEATTQQQKLQTESTTSLNQWQAISQTSAFQAEQEVASGIIDTIPLLHRELHAPAQSESDEPWQLDTGSIKRIREITQSTKLDSATDKNLATDVVIATWFNHPTGLMEIEATGRLLAPVYINDSIVNVVLDATIGLHRSVDLIAASNPKEESIPDDIRSAILAAIAAEQPSPVADIAPKPVQAGMGSLAYATSAIVVTAIAATARRRKTGKMEFTRQ